MIQGQQTNGGHRWTDQDRELVRQWYGKVPTEQLAQHFGVSRKSVSMVASYRGITHRRAKNHTWTAEEDDILRREYEHTHASKDHLAQKLGISRNQVAHRLSALGLCKRTDRRPWTPAEDQQLAKMMEEGKAQQAIARRLKRSMNSVKIRANRHLHLHFRDRSGWYTKREACEILGVDHKWLQRRIDTGILKAQPHFKGDRPQKDGLHPWHISQRNLADFIRRHAHELNGRNVDLVSLVSILVGLETDDPAKLTDDGIRHCQRLGWSKSQIAKRFGVTHNAITYRLNRMVEADAPTS